jgi:hypothetical protein
LPIISCAAFAEIAGVSRSAISQAAKPKDGKPPKLALQSDGTIDTDLPINAAYLKGRRDKSTALKKSAETPAQPKVKKTTRETIKKSDTVSPSASSPTESTSQDEPDDDDDEAIISATLEVAEEKLKYTRARRINAEADTRLKNLREAEAKKVTIHRDIVRRKWAAMDAAIKTNFCDLPRRISSRLTAIATSEGQAAVERYLEEQIGISLAKTKKEARDQGLE